MAKRGRPRLPEDIKKTIPKSFRITDHELGLIKELAKENGISESEFIRYSINVIYNIHNRQYNLVRKNGGAVSIYDYK